MTGWHAGRMAPFDLETSDKDPEHARICQAYVGLVGGGLDLVDLCEVLVDPGVPMPDEAYAIHGFSTEYLAEHGEMPGIAIDIIAANVSSAVREGVPLVGHNIRYDLTVLDRECRRHRLPTVPDRTGGRLEPVIDTQILSKHVDQYRRRVSEEQGAQVLKTCAVAFGVPWDEDGAHGARYDALIAARVAWRIGQIAALPLRERPNAQGRRREAFTDVAVGLPELHQAQVRWAAEQDAGLAAYFRDQGRRARDVDEQIEWNVRAESCSGHWPVTPFEQQGALR
jgi:DNA polymerase-3 subunit epsilon